MSNCHNTPAEDCSSRRQKQMWICPSARASQSEDTPRTVRETVKRMRDPSGESLMPPRIPAVVSSLRAFPPSCSARNTSDPFAKSRCRRVATWHRAHNFRVSRRTRRQRLQPKRAVNYTETQAPNKEVVRNQRATSRTMGIAQLGVNGGILTARNRYLRNDEVIAGKLGKV